MYLRLPYIPMDSNLPKERMNFICSAFKPIALITDDKAVSLENNEVPIFSMDEVLKKASGLHGASFEPLFKEIENPLILLIFTSGTTSPIPKGVPLRNSQLANRLAWQWSAESPLNGITGPSMVKTSCLFVDSFTEMFGPLLGGRPIVVSGTSEITSERLVTDIEILKHLVGQYQIAQITSVPTQLELWISQMSGVNTAFKSIQAIVSSGQMLPYNLALKIFDAFGNGQLRLLNLYGSTEVAGDVTAIRFDSREEVIKAAVELPTGGFVLPVGKPISNSEVYVTGEGGIENSANVVRAGSEGEVSTSGAGILIEEPILHSTGKA